MHGLEDNIEIEKEIPVYVSCKHGNELSDRNFLVRFQVLTAASTKMAAFWDIAPCSFVEVNRRFRYSTFIISDYLLLKKDFAT
jgi:hypothetical protein